MSKVAVMKDIDELTDVYCTECLVIKELRKTRGKTKANQFCIEKCSGGGQLPVFGAEVMKVGEN